MVVTHSELPGWLHRAIERAIVLPNSLVSLTLRSQCANEDASERMSDTAIEAEMPRPRNMELLVHRGAQLLLRGEAPRHWRSEEAVLHQVAPDLLELSFGRHPPLLLHRHRSFWNKHSLPLMWVFLACIWLFPPSGIPAPVGFAGFCLFAFAALLQLLSHRPAVPRLLLRVCAMAPVVSLFTLDVWSRSRAFGSCWASWACWAPSVCHGLLGVLGLASLHCMSRFGACLLQRIMGRGCCVTLVALGFATWLLSTAGGLVLVLLMCLLDDDPAGFERGKACVIVAGFAAWVLQRHGGFAERSTPSSLIPDAGASALDACFAERPTRLPSRSSHIPDASDTSAVDTYRYTTDLEQASAKTCNRAWPLAEFDSSASSLTYAASSSTPTIGLDSSRGFWQKCSQCRDSQSFLEEGERL